MECRRVKPNSLEISISKEEIDLVNNRQSVETRWSPNGEKVYVNMFAPVTEDPDSRKESHRQKEYAELDKETMEIEIYVPQAVLNNPFIASSTFNRELHNFTVTPKDVDLENMNIVLKYP
ncbi:MAG: hypothetical protein ACTSQB_01695 [Candidatus Heimdallarchaeota archaeon]